MQEWTTVDKSEWPRGQWDNEPDKAQWIDSGLDCLIVRGPVGALCGYVGVPETHPAFGQGYDEQDLGVHGGLTFSGECRPGDEGKGICHTGEVANKVVWWLGFDCSHAGDTAPTMPPFFDDDVYRDFNYVKAQCSNLARQLAELWN